MDIDLTLRGAKGSFLTHAELDANFTALRSAILAMTSGLTIAAVEQDGDRVRFKYSDGSLSQQILLPRATFSARGEWMTGEVYEVGDFYLYERSAYAVQVRHQAFGVEQDVAAGKVVLFAEGGSDGDDADALAAFPTSDNKTYGVRNRQPYEIPASSGGGISYPDDDQIYAVKRGAPVDITGALSASGGIEEAPENTKIYGRQDGVWVEIVHPETGGTGGSGDGWVYETVTILKGNVENGVTYGSFVYHADVVWKGGARVLIASKSAAVSGRQVQVYAGPDSLWSANLDGSGVNKLIPGDLTIPAGTPVDVRIGGGSATLSGPITVRLAFQLAT